jgi:hypothetical protein
MLLPRPPPIDLIFFRVQFRTVRQTRFQACLSVCFVKKVPLLKNRETSEQFGATPRRPSFRRRTTDRPADRVFPSRHRAGPVRPVGDAPSLADFALFPTSTFLYIIVCVVSIYRVDDTPSIFSSIRFDLIYFCAAKEPVESGTEQLVADRAGRAGRARDGKTPSSVFSVYTFGFLIGDKSASHLAKSSQTRQMIHMSETNVADAIATLVPARNHVVGRAGVMYRIE